MTAGRLSSPTTTRLFRLTTMADHGRGSGSGENLKTKSGTAGAAAPTWKKPSAANLSAKAKKEYLKWKREQKRTQVNDDLHSDWGPQDQLPAEQLPQPVAPAAAAAAASRCKQGARRAEDARRAPPASEPRRQRGEQCQRQQQVDRQSGV